MERTREEEEEEEEEEEPFPDHPSLESGLDTSLAASVEEETSISVQSKLRHSSRLAIALAQRDGILQPPPPPPLPLSELLYKKEGGTVERQIFEAHNFRRSEFFKHFAETIIFAV